MVGQDTVPPALRASDSDREHAIEMLRDGSALGRLSHETFLARLDIALRAQGVAELADLIKDLPRAGQQPGWLARKVRGWSAATAQAQLAWRTPRLRARA